MRTWLAARLTYANVMSTLAVFLALGGSAYAVSQINGSQIRDRSIPARKLTRHTISAQEVSPHLSVAHAVSADRSTVSDRTAHLLVTRGPRGGAARASDAAGPGLVVLSVGQQAQVLQKGPFTVTAVCADQGSGNARIDIDARSTVSGWYDAVNGGVEYQAGELVTVFSQNEASPHVWSMPNTPMLAPDGTSVDLAGWVAIHAFGDCAFSLWAVA